MGADTKAGVDGDLGTPGVESREHITASRRILAAILVTMFVSGLINGIADERQLPEPAGWAGVFAFLSSFLTFFWFRLDRNARGVRPSVWANIAVLLFGPLAIMVYLLITRPRGHKLRAVGRLAGFALLVFLAAMLGLMTGFMAA